MSNVSLTNTGAKLLAGQRVYSHKVLRSVVCTNKLETVAEVEAPDTYALVTGPGRYDDRIR